MLFLVMGVVWRAVAADRPDQQEPSPEDLAIVRVGGFAGYTDRTGAFIIAPQFPHAERFSEGLAAVSTGGTPASKVPHRDGATVIGYVGVIWGYIDPTGRFVIPPQFDWARSFSEGLAPVRHGTRWGYIDKTGTVVIPAKFADAKAFSEGLAAVESEMKPGSGRFRYGYIDRTGKLVIPPRWDNAGRFSNGQAQVNIAGMPDKIGFIDRTGRYLQRPR